MYFVVGALIAAPIGACSSDEVDSDEQARRAYLGLDKSVDRSIQLGFDGFNSAQSANIMTQTGAGSAGGTIAINGQVDQGSSANKGMRLTIGMTAYSDSPISVGDNKTVTLVYDTNTDVATQPKLDLQLKGIPTGTVDGTLAGVYHMTGDIKGDVTLTLTITGALQDAGGGKVARKPGTTHITGTAVSGAGTFHVDVMI